MAAHKIDPEIRFFKKVGTVTKDGCNLWLGGLYTGGYGQFNVNRKFISAHRFSYQHFVMPIKPGMQIHHECNNPTCVNPWHLRQVTAKENNSYSASPSAMNSKKTHCPKGHPYDEENTMLKQSRRCCRECGRLECRNRRARRKMMNIELGVN